MQSITLSRRTLLGFGAASLGLLAPRLVVAATPTAPQVEGPFYPIHTQDEKDADLTRLQGHTERALGDVIVVEGRILDTNGKPIANATVDMWQANAAGRYRHRDDPATAPLDPNFQGWTILQTDASGTYRFRTVKPAAYGVGNGLRRPPHLHFKLSGDGHRPLTTQMYFPGEPLNETDDLFAAAGDGMPALIARTEALSGDPDTDTLHRFDVVLASV